MSQRPVRTIARPAPLLSLLLALAGCGGGEDVTSRSVAEARKTWAARGPKDYDLEWTSSGDRMGHYRAFVRGGKVRAVREVQPTGKEREVIGKDDTSVGPEYRGPRTDLAYYGVEGLFKILELDLEERQADQPFGQPKGTRVLMKFGPDPQFGHPRWYRRDVLGRPKGLAIDVIRLQPDPPAAIPPAATGP